MARIIASTEPAIAEAAQRLRAGGVVAFPTETVYGLGCDVFNPAALELVYDLKGRPADNPLIAHVLDAEQARRLVWRWDDRCDRLVDRFWPGPLTLVLPKAAGVPARATAGRATIATRAPAHSIARRLLEVFGSPVAAPSANRSGRVSPTRAEHVAADFAEARPGVDLVILDGGPCAIGLESTVLDMSQPLPRILRPGAVTIEDLRETLGEVEAATIHAQAASPGTSPAHYAPSTPAELVATADLPRRLAQAREPLAVLCFDPSLVPPPHRPIAMARDPHQYARTLYSALRQADAMHAARILIERPPLTSDLWSAIADRLQRATVK